MSNAHHDDVEYYKALSKFYENLAASSEDISYYIHPIGIERKRKIISMISPSKKDVICDLGCGDGNLSAKLVTKVKRVYGVDISSTRVKRARNKGINAVCADAVLTPFLPESFDKIICSEVIEHVINPKEVFHEIKRMLKSNGCAVLTVPYNEKLEKTLMNVPKEDLALLSYKEIIRKYNIVDTHLHSFSEQKFIDLLEREKFTIKQIDYTHRYYPKSKKLIVPIAFLSKFIKRLNMNSIVLDRIIFFLYKLKKDMRAHIIVQIKNMTETKISKQTK